MLTLIELLRSGRERILRGWTQHPPARTAKGTMCGASDPAAFAWCASGTAWYADDSIPDYVNDPCYHLTSTSSPRRVRRSPAKVSPDEGYGGHLACRNDVGHRTQADAALLLRCHDRARGHRWLTPAAPRDSNMPSTYRVIIETETRPREAAVALDHLPAIQVHAPGVDLAARLALSHHIDSRPTPPPPGPRSGSS